MAAVDFTTASQCVLFETEFELEQQKIDTIAEFVTKAANEGKNGAVKKGWTPEELLDFFYSNYNSDYIYYQVVSDTTFKGWCNSIVYDDENDNLQAAEYKTKWLVGEKILRTRPEGAKFAIVDYSDSTYDAVQKHTVKCANKPIDGGLRLSPEFTYYLNGKKVTSISTPCVLWEEDENLPDGGFYQNYVLYAMFESSYIVKEFKANDRYKEMSFAIVNADANYVCRNGKFTSDNLYSFMARHADMSLEAQQDIFASMVSNDLGSDMGKSIYGISYYVSYKKIDKASGNYFMVTLTPTDAFKAPELNIPLAVLSILFAVLLIALNGIYGAILTKRVLRSIEAEKQASNYKTDFISRISHDIRTPMNGILSMAEFITTAKTLEEAKGYNESVMESGRYLLALVNDVLGISRIERGKMNIDLEPCHRFDLRESVVNEIRTFAKKNSIDIYVDDDGENDDCIMMDKMHMKQILMNLLTNAIKFSYKEGQVDFIITTVWRDDKTLKLRYTVRDRGIGMSPEFAKKMYEPFEQENKMAVGLGGSGLGLHIVKILTEAMGGKIECETIEGKGTTFTVEFVHRIIYEGDTGNSKIDVDLKVLTGKRILVVEDNDTNMFIVNKLLEDKGVFVHKASNGLEALHMFEESAQGFFNLILMDVRMPVMNGIEASQKIRSLERSDAKRVPIIAMTADAFDEDRGKVFEAGMDAHLTKPLVVADFFEVVVRLIKGEEK
ncbi:MAG: ATP-binding protein [Lachnospiraceae bacterium]|nr:ATP-binding protein [Lachnospiraceae bacterium]